MVREAAIVPLDMVNMNCSPAVVVAVMVARTVSSVVVRSPSSKVTEKTPSGRW